MYIQSRFTKSGSDWINQMSLFNRGLLVSYNLWDNLSWKKDDMTLYEIQKINKRFIRRLEKKCSTNI